jgi:hypothetical protein
MTTRRNDTVTPKSSAVPSRKVHDTTWGKARLHVIARGIALLVVLFMSSIPLSFADDWWVLPPSGARGNYPAPVVPAQVLQWIQYFDDNEGLPRLSIPNGKNSPASENVNGLPLVWKGKGQKSGDPRLAGYITAPAQFQGPGNEHNHCNIVMDPNGQALQFRINIRQREPNGTEWDEHWHFIKQPGLPTAAWRPVTFNNDKGPRFTVNWDGYFGVNPSHPLAGPARAGVWELVIPPKDHSFTHIVTTPQCSGELCFTATTLDPPMVKTQPRTQGNVDCVAARRCGGTSGPRGSQLQSTRVIGTLGRTAGGNAGRTATATVGTLAVNAYLENLANAGNQSARDILEGQAFHAKIVSNMERGLSADGEKLSWWEGWLNALGASAPPL